MTEPDDFYKKYTTIAEFLHGKNMKVSIPEDRSYYYEGICEVSDLSVSKALGKLRSALMRLHTNTVKRRQQAIYRGMM